MRLIDADALKTRIKEGIDYIGGADIDDAYYNGEKSALNAVINMINSTPTIKAALELLKEQDAVEPIRSNESDVWYCGNCDEIVGEETLTAGGIQEVRHNYCPECGRKVKWDEAD